VTTTTVFLDGLFNTATEFALCSVLGSGDGAEFVGRQFDGGQKFDCIITCLRVERVREYSNWFNSRNNDEVAALVDADTRVFRKCGYYLVGTLKANYCE
jgi:hypothetical protein